MSIALSTTDGRELFTAGLAEPLHADRRAPAASSPSASHDARLVLAARGGDRRAFAELYERFAPTVHGILLATARREDVADLVQDAFLSALRSIDRLDAPERFGQWLAAIARNCARDTHRGARRPQELTETLADALPSPAPAEHADDSDEAARVLRILRDLPEAYRETLVLRLVEGLDGPEIASRTGLTPGSVRVNLCRGMKLLRERLESGGRR